MEKAKDKQKVPAIKHTRTADFQTKIASGTVANVFGDRVELSFYNDTALYLAEKLNPIPGSTDDFTSSGEVSTAMIREHSVGVSMNFEQLNALKYLIDELITEFETGENS